MTALGAIHANNLPIDDRSFCDLVADCEIGALLSRVVNAVSEFFTYIAAQISECLSVCFSLEDSQDLGVDPTSDLAEDLIEDVFTDPLIKEEAPSKEVAAERRQLALGRLYIINALAPSSTCPPEIRVFDLDKALEKYSDQHSVATFAKWNSYAGASGIGRYDLQVVIDSFHCPSDLRSGKGAVYAAAHHLLSKIHCILDDKKARIDALSAEARPGAEEQFKKEVGHIFRRLRDAGNDCIDQTSGQLEEIAILTLKSESTLNQIDMPSLLRYKAAYILFQHRAALIREICVKDPENKDQRHMADLEREVKKTVAECLGMKGEIVTAGAYWQVVNDVATVAARACDAFWKEYTPSYPSKFFQQECQTPYGVHKAFRSDLVQWATNYYGLGSTTDDQGNEIYDDLSLALAKSKEDLESLTSLGAVELTPEGALLLLEAAGIIQLEF